MRLPGSTFRRTLLIGTVALATFGATPAFTATAAGIAPPSSTEVQPNFEKEVNRDVPNSASAAHVPASHVPRPTGLPVAGGSTNVQFSGLNFYDQRYADNGNQFSLEPPDQGLCVGNGSVLEAVNDVMRIYSTSGEPQDDVVSLTKFFTGNSQIVRATPGTATTPPTPTSYGEFLSDPKCYFDPDLQRFFLTMLEIDQDSKTGAFTGGSHTYIAVSHDSKLSIDPSDWYFYSIDTTNAGGTAGDTQQNSGGPADRALPTHPGCPCLGDQPLIGADANGFYVSNNEFSIAGPEFNGTQLYGFDKAGLASGNLFVQYIAGENGVLPLAEGPAYSLQPATSPATTSWDTDNGGTEYLMSSLDFNGTLDNRVAAWAIVNTQALATHNGTATLLAPAVLTSEVYGQPPDAEQRPGPTPLGDVIGQLYGYKNPHSGYSSKLEFLAGNDDRMNQVVYAAGHLAGAVNTVVKPQHGPTNVGIAYFVVAPAATTSELTARMTTQGYVAAGGQNVLYPAIGLNADGQGAMAFTLSGPAYYPSAAYVTFDAESGATSPVYVAGEGIGPEDGFTGYPPFGARTARWGDYSAAAVDTEGNIWLATEYIGQRCTLDEYLQNPTCNKTRALLGNWGTYVYKVVSG